MPRFIRVHSLEAIDEPMPVKDPTPGRIETIQLLDEVSSLVNLDQVNRIVEVVEASGQRRHRARINFVNSESIEVTDSLVDITDQINAKP